jgi:DNA-binding transcriptional LysR family regulator
MADHRRNAAGDARILLPRLRDGTVDCLLSRVPRTTLAATDAGTLAHTRLYEDGMCFVCATDHPLARRRKLRIEDLTGADWVLPPADTETRQVFVNTFLQAGLLPPQAHIESRSILSNLALAEGTSVLTIAPHSAALVRHRLGTLRILPVSVDAAVAPVALIWRHASADSGTLARFRELVLRCAQAKS